MQKISSNLQHKPKKWVRFAVLPIVLLISISLCIAAYGKFFYPMDKLQQLDRFTSYFEVVMIVLLCVFHMSYAVWLGVAIVFASWGGYAMYWFCLKLPCSCMGAMITFPSEYALCLDVFFFAMSGALAFLLGAARSVIYLTVLGSMLCVLVGYAFAEWVFFEKILGMVWSLF